METQVTGLRRILAGCLAVLVAAACGDITAVRSGGTSSTSKPRPPTGGRLTGPAARAFLKSAALDAARHGDSSLLEQLFAAPSPRPVGLVSDLGDAPNARGYVYADAKYDPYFVSYAGAFTQYWGSFNSGYVSVNGDFYQGDALEYTDTKDDECHSGSPAACYPPSAAVTHIRQGTCGARVVASGHHQAWQVLNGVIGPSWSDETIARSSQDPCSTCSDGGGGGGGTMEESPIARGVLQGVILADDTPSDSCPTSNGGGGGGDSMYCYTEDMCWDAYDAYTGEHLWTWCGPTTVCEAMD